METTKAQISVVVDIITPDANFPNTVPVLLYEVGSSLYIIICVHLNIETFIRHHFF